MLTFWAELEPTWLPIPVSTGLLSVNHESNDSVQSFLFESLNIICVSEWGKNIGTNRFKLWLITVISFANVV